MKLNEINDDCFNLIFSFLDTNERIAVLRVCQRWRTLILNQFARERNLLITSKLNDESSNSSNYQISPQDTFSYVYYVEGQNFISTNTNFFNLKSTNELDYSLVLSVTNKLSFYQFDRLIYKFANVKSITFNSQKNCQLISVGVLRILFERCKKLSSMDLSNCKEVNSECLKIIAKFKSLEFLNLSNCRNVGNIGLKLILRQCINLKALYISHNKRLTGQFFRFSTSKLKYLDINECTHFRTKGLNALVENLGNSLESLITFPILTNDTLKYFCTNFPNLKKLKLSIRGRIDFDILINSNFKDLKSLSLVHRIELNDEKFTRLMMNFKKIEEFEFCPDGTIESYLAILDMPRKWPNLMRLHLNYIKMKSNQNKSIIDCMLNFENLHSIQLGLTDLDNKDVVIFIQNLIQKQKLLKILNLEYFQNQFKNRQFTITIESQLSFIEKLGFTLRINQLRLSRNLAHIYWTKIDIRR